MCTGRHSEVAFLYSEIRHCCEVFKNLDFKQKSYDTSPITNRWSPWYFKPLSTRVSIYNVLMYNLPTVILFKITCNLSNSFQIKHPWSSGNFVQKNSRNQTIHRLTVHLVWFIHFTLKNLLRTASKWRCLVHFAYSLVKNPTEMLIIPLLYDYIFILPEHKMRAQECSINNLSLSWIIYLLCSAYTHLS